MTNCKDARAVILLIDDHPAVRQGVRLLLSLDSGYVCFEADSRKGAVSLMELNRVDLALLDISLGEENGLDLIGEIREHGVGVIVYSMYEDLAVIENAFNAGAMGYVTKREPSEILQQAVAVVLGGERYVSPRCRSSLASMILPGEVGVRETQLSEREKQVIRMLGYGGSSTEIADELSISRRTVESYFARIIEKLKLDGMRELRRHAIRMYK